MAQPNRKPPEGELGYVNENYTWGSSILPSWNSIMRHAEETPELKHPRSVRSYRMMMNDSQLQALYAMVTLQVRGFDWHIDPNGCDEQIVRQVGDDFGLPIKGDDTGVKRRSTCGFKWNRHLYHVLKALIPGHAYFEQQVKYLESDGKFHLKRLGYRPPETIEDFDVAIDGMLNAIAQRGKGITQRIILPVDRLAVYLWDAEDGDWIGRSMLRSCYRDWLIKDRIIRVNAINIERGGGIPVAEAEGDVSGTQMQALADVARDWAVHEDAGVATPPGTKLRIEKTSAPDAINTIRYHDESMARAWLAMFAMLGQTQTGSRALGSTFVDFFALGVQAITDELVVETTNDHVIRDLVEWNYPGEHESLPLIAYDVPDDALPVSDIISLVEAGLIIVDDEVRGWLSEAYNLPAQTVPEAAPQSQSFAYDLDAGVVTIDERRSQLGLPPREDGLGTLTVPEFLAKFGGTTETAVKPEDNPPADTEASSGKRGWFRRNRTAAGESPFRRELTAAEVASKTDFEKIDEATTTAADDLLESWRSDVKPQQIDELVAAIKEADGDAALLAALVVATTGDDALAGKVESTFNEGYDSHVQEAADQGVAIGTVDKKARDTHVDLVTVGIAGVLASGIAMSASARAVALTGSGLAPAEVAESVATYLNNLTDATSMKSIRGAVQRTFNGGRFTAMKTAEADAEFYGSELLDGNTCDACATNDGHQYDSLDELQADYPGGFIECEGGENCRGTGVAVYKGGDS